MFGLSYLPTAQRLSFSIIKAINLRFESVVSNLESFGEYFKAFEMITRMQRCFWYNQIIFSGSNSPERPLKTGLDKIIYWLGRFSFLLGFIMPKEPKGLWFHLLIKSLVCNLSRFFWNNTTQEERKSTKSINYLIWPRL